MSRQRSIKWQLIRFVSLLSTLPVIFLGLFVLFFSSKQLEGEINSKNLLLSKIFINQIEKYLEGPARDMQSIANVIVTKGLNQQTSIFFEELLFRNDHFIKFIVTNGDGYVTHVFPEDLNLLQSDLSRRDFFTEVNRTGSSYWSKVFISSPNNIPVTALSVPLDDGILTAHLDMSYLSKITKDLSETRNIIVSVTDQTGTYLAHSIQEKVLQRGVELMYSNLKKEDSGSIIQADMIHNGVQFVCHVGFIRQTGWSIMISQPLSETYLPVKRLLWVIVSLTALLFVFSIYISYRYGITIKQTLDKFIKSTAEIAEGQYESKMRRVKYTEFNQLADSIVLMAKKVEQREIDILESQAMFRAIFQSEAVGISIMNPDLTFQMVNNKWQNITGYNEDDLADKITLSVIIDPEDWPETDDNLKRIIAGTEKLYRQEKRLLKKDGSQIWVSHSIALIEGDGEKFLVGMLVDITEQKEAQLENEELQKKLQQAYKLEAVGTLAGGIAHDFNNILSAVIGHVELAKAGVEPGTLTENHLTKTLQATERATKLVQQILAFSRQDQTEAILFQPASVIKESVKMLRPMIPSTINILQEIQTDTGSILADPGQLSQVMTNLCINAFHAMEKDGGTLTISFSECYLDKGEQHYDSGIEPGQYVRLAVADSGTGIPTEIRDKVFDPFFTTKSTGKGSGMGLAIVHGIVMKYHGYIFFDSNEETGTTFYVYFPVANVSHVNQPKIQELAQIVGGAERILFVDDEEMLATTGKEILESLGYSVDSHTSSAAALEAFQLNPDDFDLVITDQTMPEITGEELARSILQIRPDTPIILCTGYSTMIDEEAAYQLGIKGFVMKPFTINKLANTIREALT